MTDRTRVSRYFARYEVLRGSGVRTWDDLPGSVRRALTSVCRAADVLRHEIGLPLTVVSGYRDPGANRKAEGVPKSQHLLGLALDLRPAGPRENVLHLYDLADRLMRTKQIPCGGLACYSLDDPRDAEDHGRPRFCHVDIRGRNQRFKRKQLRRARAWFDRLAVAS